MSQPMEQYHDPRRTAFLVHCMQNAIVKGEGPPYYLAPERERLVHNFARVLERTRSLGILVLHVVLERRVDDPDFLFPASDAPFSYPFAGPTLLPGTRSAAIVDEVHPRDDERVITKPRFGAFYGTPLEHVLRVHGIDTLLIGDMYADLGVEMTAREAWDRGFRVVVLSDCCGTLSPAAWERVMAELLPRFAQVRTSDQVLSLLAR
ncbi:MAG: cysteine hydrolase [Chloroflexi bacterium]|nr:cysteine hydrolase [Chloroflexota bacterium]